MTDKGGAVTGSGGPVIGRGGAVTGTGGVLKGKASGSETTVSIGVWASAARLAAARVWVTILMIWNCFWFKSARVSGNGVREAT